MPQTFSSSTANGESSVKRDTPIPEPPDQRTPTAWRAFLGSSDVELLATGVLLTVLFGVAMVVIRDWWPRLFTSLLTMLGLQLGAGLLTGIFHGFSSGLPRWAVLSLSVFFETLMILYFYPLFVLSCRRLQAKGPLKSYMARARRAAVARRDFVKRFGIPGLFIFVWLPFRMTGALAGCALGYLMGLRTWVTLTVALSATVVAALTWGVLLERVYKALVERFGPYAPTVVVIGIVAIVFILQARRMVRRRRRRRGSASDEDAGDIE